MDPTDQTDSTYQVLLKVKINAKQIRSRCASEAMPTNSTVHHISQEALKLEERYLQSVNHHYYSLLRLQDTVS